MSHVISLVEKQGADCWWKLPVADLLSRDVIEQVNTFELQVVYCIDWPRSFNDSLAAQILFEVMTPWIFGLTVELLGRQS